MVSWQIAPAPERRSRAAHPAGENPSSRSARTRHASTGSAIRRLWRGRLLSSSARCWAPTARYRSRPPLRPTSLLMVDASRPRVKAIEASATIGSSTRKARISSRSSGDKAGPGMLWSPSVRLHVCTGHHDRIMHRPMEPAVPFSVACKGLPAVGPALLLCDLGRPSLTPSVLPSTLSTGNPDWAAALMTAGAWWPELHPLLSTTQAGTVGVTEPGQRAESEWSYRLSVRFRRSCAWLASTLLSLTIDRLRDCDSVTGLDQKTSTVTLCRIPRNMCD